MITTIGMVIITVVWLCLHLREETVEEKSCWLCLLSPRWKHKRLCMYTSRFLNTNTSTNYFISPQREIHLSVSSSTTICRRIKKKNSCLMQKAGCFVLIRCVNHVLLSPECRGGCTAHRSRQLKTFSYKTLKHYCCCFGDLICIKDGDINNFSYC